MCSFVAAAAVISIGATVLATQQQAAAQKDAGRAAQQRSEYQATIARNNKIVADRAATDALAIGGRDAAQAGIEARRLKGVQTAALAGAGIGLSSVTAQDIIGDTAGAATLDQLTIRANAQRQANAFITQGQQFETDATLNILEGQQAVRAAGFRQGTTLLAGAGSVASKWFGFQKEGAFS